MSNATHARPRRIATAGRISVVVGSGLALGVLSAHVQSEALAKNTAQPAAAVRQAKPKVVTIVRKKHVKSDPVVVYRQAPAGTTSTGTPASTTTSTGTSRSFQPAPAPAPAANPPAATSTAS